MFFFENETKCLPFRGVCREFLGPIFTNHQVLFIIARGYLRRAEIYDVSFDLRPNRFSPIPEAQKFSWFLIDFYEITAFFRKFTNSPRKAYVIDSVRRKYVHA